MNPLIHMENIGLHLPQLSLPILKNISYSILPGDFIMLIGSNGSGKSSLLKLLDGRYRASSGFLKNKIHKKNIKTITQNDMESLFPTLTVFENYLLVQQHQGQLRNKRIEKLFLKDYLNGYHPNLSSRLDQPVQLLSGGERQALILALTLLYPPQLLLLDEFTSALDPHAEEKLMALTREKINDYSITCVAITHDLMIAAKYGNRLVALKEGEIYAALDEEKKRYVLEKDLKGLCYA